MTLLPFPCCRQDPVREPFVLDEPCEDNGPHHARGESERVVVEPPGVAVRADLPLEEAQEATCCLRESMPNGGALAPRLAPQGGKDTAAAGVFDVSPGKVGFEHRPEAAVLRPEDPIRRVLGSGQDGGRYQFVAIPEVTVEPAMGETRLLHESRNAHSGQPVAPERVRSCLDDAGTHFFLVAVRVTHWMTIIMLSVLSSRKAQMGRLD
jgi:hypothetical protein